MNKSIIDDVDSLLSLSDEELDEVLLDNKYNKANLRELVRRLIKSNREYEYAWRYEREERLKLEDKFGKLKYMMEDN